jgi:hypothetical protein
MENRNALIAGAAVVLVSAAALGWWSTQRDKAPTSGGAGAPVGSASSTNASGAPASRAAYQNVGCTCDAQVGGAKRRVQLAVSATGKSAAVDWIADVGGDWFVLADPARDDTAPPRRPQTHVVSLGMACGDDLFVTSWSDRVTGWSVSKKAPLFSAKLPEPRAAFAGPGSARGISVGCQDLPIADGVVSVKLSNGKVMKVKVADGSVSE